jgi:hypothetical protein
VGVGVGVSGGTLCCYPATLCLNAQLLFRGGIGDSTGIDFWGIDWLWRRVSYYTTLFLRGPPCRHRGLSYTHTSTLYISACEVNDGCDLLIANWYFAQRHVPIHGTPVLLKRLLLEVIKIHCKILLCVANIEATASDSLESKHHQ